MNNDEVAVVDLDELEPMVLAKITEATGTAPDGTDDSFNVVWGNE